MEIDRTTDLPIFHHKDLIELMYEQLSPSIIDALLCQPDDLEVLKYNQNIEEFFLPKLNLFQSNHISKKDIDYVCQNSWLMPQSYLNINIKNYLLDKCNCQEEISRVKQELQIYTQKNLINLLRYMIYLKDISQTYNIIIGVGRGSSVASFVLYLIGIHKINPIKYNLDFNEFLK